MGAPERVLRPEAAGEDIVEKVFRIVHVHLDFFEDNLAFFLDVFGIELGAKDEIGEDIERDGEMGVENLGVEADLFLGGESVEHAAVDGIHFLRAMSSAERRSVPLNTMCSRKWGGAVFGGGLRGGKPWRTQIPTETERTCCIVSSDNDEAVR